jgi:pimeloyl-ACP methyl ester carboxylesterase
VTGIGHSIGASTLLGLAGGRMWLDASGPMPIDHEPRLVRLALLAPAAGFFMAPGALERIDVPVLAIGASQDTVTPPAQTEFLSRELAGRVPVEMRIVQGAGHFSFMDQPPPHVNDPLPDRGAFLERLADDLAGFALH